MQRRNRNRRNHQRRSGGFTLIEILVVITIIAALAGLVVALVPQLIGKSEETQSMNNLKNIGGLLMTKKAAGDMKKWSGAAFLLQVKDQVMDEDLKVFVSPSDDNFPDRPLSGTDEFIAMYRELKDMKTGVEDKHCSYAGPNWAKFPEKKTGREALRSRLWGCDRCYEGSPFHAGVVVLYGTSKVEILKLEEIKGADVEQGIVQVGLNSPDERLKKMCYLAGE